MLDSWTPPREIGHFLLEHRLGRGATADVWLARDTLLDRAVALKIANTPASVEMRARFRVEARAVAKLQHPNLLAIHHIGEVGDRPFIVTERLSGRSLDQIDRPVPPERVVAIGIDLARGLAAVHRAGVLHRDIKPANAFLGDDGVAKLLDFGLAKVGGAPALVVDPLSRSSDPRSSPAAFDATQVDSTLSGRLAGTPLYMAPETWRGETATPKTDVYSLGALLFELLTGQLPYMAPGFAELQKKVLAGDPDSLVEWLQSVPPALVDLVTRCLRLARDERPTADEVCDALARVVPPAASALAEALDDPRANPYRGLGAFEPEHRALFFGREAETATVVAELRASPFVLVAGASGAGKSSLVRAGVVPRVEKGALGGGAAWKAVVLVPGGRPIDVLAQAMAPALGLTEADARARLTASPAWLAGELRTAPTRLLVVIDQLEEIWTMAPAHEREAFFAIIAALALSARTVRVIATVRSDFLERLEDMGELQAHALRALVVLRPMTPEGLRGAIVEPAARRGVAIEPALVERLVAGAEGGSLPLLEFALAELYARRDPGKSTIGVADLDALGGVEGALAAHADATLARLPATQKVLACKLLLALVTTERTRARREERDLLAGGAEETREALDALVEARLVIVGAGDHGPAYEVAHEALIAGWPALRALLGEEAASREAVERVRRAAREWSRADRAEEALFAERQLAELDLVEGRSLDPECDAFLQASRATLRRARARRLALRVGAPVGVLLLGAAVAGAIRWSERRQARMFVAARLVEAEPAVSLARDLDADVALARKDAFARYDAGDIAAGESRWRDALALARRESDAFAAASAPLGLALARDPLAPTARVRTADLVYDWLLAAERDHEPDVARDLAARLAPIDDDGSRRARLAARARLLVTTSAPGERAVLHRVQVDRDGRSAEDAGAAIALDAPLDLAPASYVLDLSADGRSPVRYPVLLRRADDQRLAIPLLPAAAVPAGFVFVPAGTSLEGSPDVEGIRAALSAQPEHAVFVGAFLIAEHEVTYAEYLDFLASLPPADRAARRPHARDVDLTFDADGVPVLSLGAAKARRGDPLCRPRRTARRCQSWLRLPVAGITWEDAEAYVAWLAGGRVSGARLCTEREWERAARGADGRLYTCGNALSPGDADFDATYAADADQMGADEVGSFPADRSPFGILDLAGNVAEWVGERTSRAVRGGFWSGDVPYARATYRLVRGGLRSGSVGTRVCASAPPAP